MIPALGPTELAILDAVAPSGGLTVAEIGQRLGREPGGLQRSVSGLEGKGCVRVLTYRRGVGPPAKVWVATAAGRQVLAARQQEGARP